MQKKYLIIIALTMFLSGCATHYTSVTYADPYGFFSGILHGLIFPIALLINILSWVLSFFGVNFFSEVQLVGKPNTGFFFYYVGYFLGITSWSSARA